MACASRWIRSPRICTQLETWHRLNPDPANIAPEHERLQCLPGVQWVCRYDKLLETDFHWDRTIGMFHGRDIDVSSWDCPEWFATEVCEGAEQVVGGTINFNEGFRTGQELVFTSGGGIAPLYVYWTDFRFACPWYDSFADALDANPDASADDCFFP